MKKNKMADPRMTRVSDLRPGQYADGSPLDDVRYLECKLSKVWPLSESRDEKIPNKQARPDRSAP